MFCFAFVRCGGISWLRLETKESAVFRLTYGYFTHSINANMEVYERMFNGSLPLSADCLLVNLGCWWSSIVNWQLADSWANHFFLRSPPPPSSLYSQLFLHSTIVQILSCTCAGFVVWLPIFHDIIQLLCCKILWVINLSYLVSHSPSFIICIM